MDNPILLLISSFNRGVDRKASSSERYSIQICMTEIFLRFMNWEVKFYF